MSPVPQPLGEPAQFNTTHWSVVVAAGQEATPSSREALENLCRTYWRPIYGYIRRRGSRPEEAEDLAQAFFEHVLERKLFSVADRRRGRFRTFLLHCCEYFLAKQWRDQQRLKRGGGLQLLSLEASQLEDWYQLEPADPITPERLYERSWALAVLRQAHDRLRLEWEQAGKATLFQTLEAHLSGEREAVPYAQAAIGLGMSEGAIRTAVHRLRHRYGELLRLEVAQTVTSVDDLEDELHHLLNIL
jgi:RNA polymerase sigma-70 factor (ECF subfamily)